jgi:hypothetical protein
MCNTRLKALVISGLISCLFSIVSAYSGGTGTEPDPYQIANANDLLELAADTNDYNDCFILINDINMVGQVFTKAIIGFQGTTFTGTFDGNGRKITNFTINGGSNDYLGLFGRISSSGSVKNLGLENFSVSGSSSVGGLVGDIYNSSISNCYATGMVSSSSYFAGGLIGSSGGVVEDSYANCIVDGNDVVGGLIGMNKGDVSRCFAAGTVSGRYYTGGLTGDNHPDYTISDSYSFCTVSGDFRVGGLTGNNWGTISNCYAMGNITGNEDIGGLVGTNNSSAVINCYSTGTVIGYLHVGGLVGSCYNTEDVNASFWDIETSGQTTSDGGTGLTTAQMQNMDTFTSVDWDFVDIWNIGENQTYPFLRMYSTGDLNYDGRVDFVDFALFADDWLNITSWN